MKYLLIYFQLFFVFSPIFLHAAIQSNSTSPLASRRELSKAGYLRKLSYQLRGKSPSIEEYRMLQSKSETNEINNFIELKINEYLNSAEAEDRMAFRLSERFQIKTSDISIHQYKQDLNQNASIPIAFPKQDSLTYLFRRLVKENLSWDQLLVGKKYNAFPDFNSTYSGDFDFFRLVSPGLPKTSSVYRFNKSETDYSIKEGIPLTFAEDDLRVSGAITTHRFLNRYNTTNINKNRKRAAAVFRIFLCDSMVPIIPPPDNKKDIFLNQAFDDESHENVTEKQLETAMNITDSTKHGNNPNCAICHYKLDPMGKLFQNTGNVLNPEPSSGELTYNKSNNELLKIKLNGLGELGRELVKQSEYRSCQVKWFWKEFIGYDVSMTAEREKQINESFDSLGRKTNDFIRYLVHQPEFRQKPLNLSNVGTRK